jgi:hypothetical protein
VPEDAGVTVPVPTLDTPLGPELLLAAEAATDLFYAEVPEIAERYGERGRAYAAHDHAYLFAWAVDAAELDSPELFERNARWLHSLLMDRGFPHAWFVRTMELVQIVAVESGLLSEDDAARVIGRVIPLLEIPR